MNLVPCPGCRGLFPDVEGPTHRYMEASPGCWAAFGELMAREYIDPGFADYYRLSVDAYAVQHPGQPSRQSIQSVGIHLIRLYLLLECGSEMARANDIMINAGHIKHTFVWLQPPPSVGDVTVANLVGKEAGAELKTASLTWATSAWSAWSIHHATIKHWASKLPGVNSASVQPLT